MKLTDLPPEVLDHAVQFIENPSDLERLARTSKLLWNIARPHFSRFLNFGIPSHGFDWNINGPFSRITDHQQRHVQHIEVIHSSLMKKWGPSDVRLNLSKTYKEREENAKRKRLAGTPDDPEATTSYFNEKLAEFVGKLKPGQLQSFKFTRTSYYKGSYEVEVRSRLLKALNGPHTRLTKLTLSFEPWLEYKNCSVLNFPHLLYFRYSSYNVLQRHHAILSILSSCQDTLEELHASNWQPPGSPFGDPEVFQMGNALASWKECENCAKSCQQVGVDERLDSRLGVNVERRIRLRNLKIFKCSGSGNAHSMAKTFLEEKILDGVPLLKYNNSHSISISSYDSNAGVDWWRYFSYSSGAPRTQKELADFLGTTEGLGKLTLKWVPLGSDPSEPYECADCDRWEWLEGLKTRNQGTLRKLKLDTWILSPDVNELENIGKSLPNLENLILYMKKSVWPETMPDCIFDKEVFPKLRVFRNTQTPYRNDVTLRDKLCQKVLASVSQGNLSSNLQQICIGSPNYVFKIERDGGGTKLEGTTCNGELTVDEALERYGIRVTESLNPRACGWRLRPEEQGKRNP
ncbi:hypothetical protein TWF281_004842 [Arthrobotrys megalospora]